MAPAAGPLRVACLGDSWISDYERGENADYWKLDSHLPEALHATLSAESDRDVELVIAGFPGFTAGRVLELAKLCRLRDMARVHERRGVHLYPEGSLKSSLWELNIPCAYSEADSPTVEEDVDLVVIIAGYNDLDCHQRGCPDATVETLLELRRLYASRGIEAVLVTIGEGRREVEKLRRRANRRLLSEGWPYVVACDDFVRGLGREMWANMTHFTPDGYRALGAMLGEVVARQLSDGTLSQPSSPRCGSQVGAEAWQRPWCRRWGRRRGGVDEVARWDRRKMW